MKLIKGLGLLSFLVIISGSCFDPPEFPVVPEIEFENIEFIPAPTPFDFDSLILYIRFKDGDGDLGLNQTTEDNSDPFHNAFFYQEINDGIDPKIEPLTIEPGLIGNDQYDLLLIPNPENGKLVFFRSRLQDNYNFLPQAYHCSKYEILSGPVNSERPSDGRRLLIEVANRAVLDDEVVLIDSFPRENPQYYQIKDTLYFTPNENHYNIEVDFLIKDPSAPGGFVTFDWREEYCLTFDGRFPVFSDDPPSSIDGTLRYSMTSFGFKTLFSIKTLKLRISIKDRARNRSNVIETPEFRL